MSNTDSNTNVNKTTTNNTNESNPDSKKIEEEPLHLFKPPRIRHPEYWQCVKLIAKSSLPADMKSKNALNAYCTFLIDTQTYKDIDPLIWWKTKRFNYPNVARIARKWLSVPATSTPSERVFSICGLVDTTKRSNLLGESIEKQVFLHNKYG